MAEPPRDRGIRRSGCLGSSSEGGHMPFPPQGLAFAAMGTEGDAIANAISLGARAGLVSMMQADTVPPVPHASSVAQEPDPAEHGGRYRPGTTVGRHSVRREGVKRP
ncbi:hypothetical protein GQ53DRAFT_330830 [Thozetella sp. PMI_491]|nr:hypothetical protein GQ53DRAFT_330830 [Thozetella sp. PMI_491]